MILQIHYTTRTARLQNLNAHKLKERAKGAAIFCAKAAGAAYMQPPPPIKEQLFGGIYCKVPRKALKTQPSKVYENGSSSSALIFIFCPSTQRMTSHSGI